MLTLPVGAPSLQRSVPRPFVRYTLVTTAAAALALLSLLWARPWRIDAPVLFILLTLIYLSEALVRFGIPVPLGARLVALWQFINGIWLMYLTYALTLDLATPYHWPF